MKIVAVVNGYPDRVSSTTNVFVKELIDEWVKLGEDVNVICPVTIIRFIQILLKGHDKNCLYPLYFEFSIFKRIKFFRKICQYIDDQSFFCAVKRKVGKSKNIVLYAHFLNAGLAVAKIAKERGVTAYCAVGESTLWSLRYRDMEKVRTILSYITGFIAVSSSNKEMLLSNSITEEKKIIVIPNAVDRTIFHKKDKQKCRTELGLPIDKCIGIFVGHFNDRKGAYRVSEACAYINDIEMIYIGKGEQKPTGGNIAYLGQVDHDKLADYLNAADFFVLPTLAEGCCNAIVEAISCGLPIISSKDRFNDDILSDSYSIRVDPRNIDDIKEAIETLVYDKNRLLCMSIEAEKNGRKFDLQQRAKLILDYIGIISNHDEK